MSPEELIYYRERARAERECAEAATNPHAVEIHLKLAALYESLIDLDEVPSPRIHIAEAMSPSH